MFRRTGLHLLLGGFPEDMVCSYSMVEPIHNHVRSEVDIVSYFEEGEQRVEGVVIRAFEASGVNKD